MYRTLLILFTKTIFAAPILIGIAGGTGSGKTTLAQKIHEAFPNESVLISQDSYYKDLGHLPFEKRGETNFDHPDSLDTTLFQEQLAALQAGLPIEQPIYDFHTGTRGPNTLTIAPKPLLIVEGILLFTFPEIRDSLDVKIFVDTPDDIRILRRIDRDMKERGRSLESTHKQYLATVKPMHDAFVAPSKNWADLIVPEGGQNEVAVDLILAKLRKDLQI